MYLLQASIIGYRTKKVLFDGVRNRHYVTCGRESHKNIDVPNMYVFLTGRRELQVLRLTLFPRGLKKAQKCMLNFLNWSVIIYFIFNLYIA